MLLEDILRIYKQSNKKLLQEDLPKILKKFGYVPQAGEKYLYAEGNIPLLLVSHVDTVHATTPEFVFYDKEHRVLWSPTGLGADDRAGVTAIIELIQRGYRPCVLFTDEEETGCGGAKEAAKSLSPDVRYIIELDRRGSKDCVFYSCDNEEFTKYIGSYGFAKSEGSLSDISTLCPMWGIAGVNLSVGYYNAHTKYEYLKLEEWEETINKVETMLLCVPDQQFEYIEKVISYEYLYGTTSYYGKNKNYYDRYSYLDSYYDSYFSPKGTSYKSSSKFASEKIELSITAEELFGFLGGSEGMWEEWIADNQDWIEYELFEYVLAIAEQDFPYLLQEYDSSNKDETSNKEKNLESDRLDNVYNLTHQKK